MKKGKTFELDRIYKRQNYDEQKEWLLQNALVALHDAGDEFKAVDESVEGSCIMKKSLSDLLPKRDY